MIDVQWEKAKHVTEHPHPGGFLLRDGSGELHRHVTSKHYSAKSIWKHFTHKRCRGRDPGWFLALVADLWKVLHWQQGNTVIIRGKEPSQQTQAGFTERIVFAQSEQLYMIISPHKFIYQYFFINERVLKS